VSIIHYENIFKICLKYVVISQQTKNICFILKSFLKYTRNDLLGIGTFPKWEAKFNNHLVLGPYFENAPTLRLHLTPMNIGIPN
jgi:hypothetical protein